MANERKRRLPSLKKLYASLKDAPPNIASLKVTDEGFEVSFRDHGTGDRSKVGDSALPAQQVPASKLVPGTPFPDDGSPINAADLVLSPIDLAETSN